MADSVRVKKLDVFDTIKDGFSIGLGNLVPIFVNVLLWVVTIWIPYLNVGTTIGLWVGIISKAASGKSIPMTEIFDPKYRKYMGEFFLTSALVGIGISAGLVFIVIPGIVIGIAWCFALLLVVDKGKNVTEAMTLSNNYTYGNKWRIFWAYFIVLAVSAIITYAVYHLVTDYKVSIIIASLISFLMTFVLIGLQASVYKQLAAKRG